MGKTFSPEQELAILKKINFLVNLQTESDSLLGLDKIRINKKREWMHKFGADLVEKYKGLPPEEQAYKIIYSEHMGLDLADVPMTRISSTKIRIESRNFCPYLEACLEIDLDTRIICKDTGEASFQAMAEMVDSRLKFSRNYQNIRPYTDYCEKFIEIVQ